MKKILFGLLAVIGFALCPVKGNAQALYGLYQTCQSQSPMGQALAGTAVYFLTQPANTTNLTPLATVYSNATGIGGPVTQPIYTNGFGYCSGYVLPGVYTVCYVSPVTGKNCFPDQTVLNATGIQHGYTVTDGGGLTAAITDGLAWCSGSIVTYAGGTLSLTANTTNYIYLNTASSCVPAVKTTNFVQSDVPVATVVTNNLGISTITDDSTLFNYTPAPSVTWPPSGDLVVSTDSNSPAGLTEVDGDCAIGISGAWDTGACGSTLFQQEYTQQGTGQYVLVPFTSNGCSSSPGSGAAINGTPGNPPKLGGGGFSLGSSGGASCSFTAPVLTGISPSQITAIYAVGFQSQSVYGDGGGAQLTSELTFSGTSLAGCTVLRNGVSTVSNPSSLQYGCQITGTLTNIGTITASVTAASAPFHTDSSSWSFVPFLEVDYTGSPVTPSQTVVSLGPGLEWDQASDTISLQDFAVFPISVNDAHGFNPFLPSGTMVLVDDGATSTDCSTGGGGDLVWCEADGAGNYTGTAFSTPTPTWQASLTFVGTPGASQLLFFAPSTIAVTIPSGCAGSYMGATGAATGTEAYTIKKLAGGPTGSATTLCTATFSSGNTASFSGSGGSLAAGDYLEIVGPASATVTNLGGAIYGTH